MSLLRKAIYRRNVAGNNYKKYEHKYWEENHRESNNMLLHYGKSSNHFAKKCTKRDKSFWATILQFMTGKKT